AIELQNGLHVGYLWNVRNSAMRRPCSSRRVSRLSDICRLYIGLTWKRSNRISNIIGETRKGNENWGSSRKDFYDLRIRIGYAASYAEAKSERPRILRSKDAS